MDNAFHTTNVVMETRIAPMAVMNSTAVSDMVSMSSRKHSGGMLLHWNISAISRDARINDAVIQRGGRSIHNAKRVYACVRGGGGGGGGGGCSVQLRT